MNTTKSSSGIRTGFGKGLLYLDKHLGILFLLPGLLIIVGILIYPIFLNIYLSFTNAHLIFPDVKFVGLKNYITLLTEPRFFNAVKISAIWTVGTVFLQLIFGLVTATHLKESSKANMVFRSLVIIPFALPPISVALMWKWMLNSAYGIVNYILMQINIIDIPIAWLSNLNTALPVAIFINTWFGFPLMTITIIAGLQSIPSEHYEVADIEGASGWQTFWNVTIPGIKQIVGIMIILRIIWVFNGFDILYLLTGGGPLRSTEALPILAYYTGWKSQLVGKTGAIATLLFLFLLLLMSVYFKLVKIEDTE